jgi:UDP-N-acetylmuramoyl-tripeptide--D-alanyl-D-alanine ligase
MPAFSTRDLKKWSGGQWKAREPSAVQGVSTDTRTIKPGNLYVAIRGANHDGHDFVAQAFARGASAAVVAEPFAAQYPSDDALLCVKDPLKALGGIAAGYRGTLKADLVAVTGSVGKTTVKEMIADVLQTRGPTARTRGNWNNDIGLPLSLLAMDPGERFGVYELGMNHPGELEPLCNILRPSWGVITNVGPVHLEFFKSVADIAREKATVFKCLPEDGAAVLSRDDKYFEILRDAAPCRVITTAVSGEADYEGRVLSAADGQFNVLERATGEQTEFSVPLPGDHVLKDALFAVAVGRGLGVPWDDLKSALKRYAPPPMRWNRVTIAGVRVINDAYNANPMSMRAALDAFIQTPVKGRRWLVLGGMRELGATEKDEHVTLGREIAKGSWAGLIAVGRLGEWIAEGAETAGVFRGQVIRCADHIAAARILKENMTAGDAILLKASRGEQLEKVLEDWSGDRPVSSAH